MINVDRSVPCYSTSLPSPFLLRSLSPPQPPLSSSTTYVHTFLDVDSVLTMRVHLLDRRTARWKRRKGSPPSCRCFFPSLPSSLASSFSLRRSSILYRTDNRYDYLSSSGYRPVESRKCVRWEGEVTGTVKNSRGERHQEIFRKLYANN